MKDLWRCDDGWVMKLKRLFTILNGVHISSIPKRRSNSTYLRNRSMQWHNIQVTTQYGSGLRKRLRYLSDDTGGEVYTVAPYHCAGLINALKSVHRGFHHTKNARCHTFSDCEIRNAFLMQGPPSVRNRKISERALSSAFGPCMPVTSMRRPVAFASATLSPRVLVPSTNSVSTRGFIPRRPCVYHAILPRKILQIAPYRHVCFNIQHHDMLTGGN